MARPGYCEDIHSRGRVLMHLPYKDTTRDQHRPTYVSAVNSRSWVHMYRLHLDVRGAATLRNETGIRQIKWIIIAGVVSDIRSAIFTQI